MCVNASDASSAVLQFLILHHLIHIVPTFHFLLAIRNKFVDNHRPGTYHQHLSKVRGWVPFSSYSSNSVPMAWMKSYSRFQVSFGIDLLYRSLRNWIHNSRYTYRSFNNSFQNSIAISNATHISSKIQ